MRAPLWRLVEGPEWADSVEAADPGDGYFEDNLEALRLALEYGPFKYSTPFIDDRDDLRVATTKDPRAGYRLVAFIRIAAPTVELKWVMLEDLLAEERT